MDIVNAKTTSCMSNGIRRRSAFTLMEIILVLVVLLTLASVVMPAMTRLQQRMPLDAATMLVRNEVSRTRVLAIDRAEPWSFEIAPDGKSFQRYPLLTNIKQIQFELPAGIHFANTPEPLQFRSDGTTCGAILTLQDAEGFQQHLKLDRLTGTIDVLKK